MCGFVKEEKMCNCPPRGKCKCKKEKTVQAQLVPGLKYKHKSWSYGRLFLAMTSTGKFVFEDEKGNSFQSSFLDPDEFTWVKPKEKRWINIYKNDQVGMALHKSKEEADRVAGAPSRIDCIEVEVNVE